MRGSSAKGVGAAPGSGGPPGLPEPGAMDGRRLDRQGRGRMRRPAAVGPSLARVARRAIIQVLGFLEAEIFKIDFWMPSDDHRSNPLLERNNSVQFSFE